MVSNLLIEALFENGSSQSVSAFPLRAVYQTIERREGHAPVQILISVPHKQLLWECLADNQEMLLGFIWLSDRHYPTSDVESRVVRILEKVKK